MVMIEGADKPIAVVLSAEKCDNLAKPLQPRECGRHLLSGAGIDVDALMAVSIEDMFADYMPEDKYLAGVKQEALETHPAASCDPPETGGWTGG